MKKYLCYYELHIGARLFYIHKLVEAESGSEALDLLVSQWGEHYHLQCKGCLGEFTIELAKKYLTSVGDLVDKNGAIEKTEYTYVKGDGGVLIKSKDI